MSSPSELTASITSQDTITREKQMNSPTQQASNVAFADAVLRAKQIAAKLSNQHSVSAAPVPNTDMSVSVKRQLESDDQPEAKKLAISSDVVSSPQLAAIKAQQVAQQINQQLGMVKKEEAIASSNQFMLIEEFRIPDNMVGLVIGRGGEKIARIQQDSACKVQIAADSNGLADRMCTLTGTKESIDKAKQLINEVVQSGKMGAQVYESPNNIPLGMSVIEIMVPGHKCGLIIGKGGETIKRLSEQYDVKMVVIQDTNDPTVLEKPLRITGEPEKVERARQAIHQMLSFKPGENPMQGLYGEYGNRRSDGPVIEASFNVPVEKAGIVIGKGGESIKYINRESGAFVEIDKSQKPGGPGHYRVFNIRGTQNQIMRAQHMIYDKCASSPGGAPNMMPPPGHPSLMSGMQQRAPMPPMNGPGYNHTGVPQAYGNSQAWNNNYNQAAMWQQPVTPAAPSVDPTKQQMDQSWQSVYQNYYQPPQQATQQTQPQQAQQQPQRAAAGPVASAPPVTNPQTGQPDYSLAWAEYYRSLGMHEQADAILRQAAQNQALAAAQASVAVPSPTQNIAPVPGPSGQMMTSPASQQQQQSQPQQQWAGYPGYPSWT